MQSKKGGYSSPITTNSPTPTTLIKKRPPLALLGRGGSVLPSPEVSSASSSRESAFSFHQNPRTTLLFGKNNVFTYDGEKEEPGYLSLLQDHNRLLTLKWTPNALLNSEQQPSTRSPRKLSTYFTSISIRMEIVTHLHLHQNDSTKSIFIVLIDSDGVQQFFFKFTLKQHCLAFLNSLEIGLAPLFRIDPSLDSIKFKEIFLTNKTQENTQKIDEMKIFGDSSNHNMNWNSKSGLVFRIISFASTTTQSHKSMKKSSRTISRISTQDSSTKGEEPQTELALKDSLANATRAMRNQIVGRAFYGWLSYCRHLRTIRTNLANIVTPINEFLRIEPANCFPVNEVFWNVCRSEKTIQLYEQFLTRVYFCGIEQKLRPQIWPYLLRIVDWHEEMGLEKLAKMKMEYERDCLEWMEIERELAFKEREKEQHGGSFIRENSSADVDNSIIVFKDFTPHNYSSSMCSDVFDDAEFQQLMTLEETTNGQELIMGEKMILIKEFAANLSRIQKDVDRCDRVTQFYSKTENLQVLSKIMCTHVYRRLKADLQDGYVQGMCDLLAPLLVIFRDDALTLAAFERLMQRMKHNFPQNKQTNGMEENLNYFRCLVEVLDPELYAQLMKNVDYSFVVFYRWLLLDFKRELLYNEVFQLWEVIWAAEIVCSRHFSLFFGLALLTQYRGFLIQNEMDFTDVIKFFNEMAEKHEIRELLDIARKKILAFQEIVQELNNNNKLI